MRGEDLDRDGPRQAGIARAVDLAHAAGAKRTDDLIRSEPCTAGDGHGGPIIVAGCSSHPRAAPGATRGADTIRVDVTLPAGARLGPYEIVGPLGSGGMGEVYRARDGRLNRDVAIKV